VTEKMTEKFTDVINTMMQQFTKAIGDIVEGKMSVLSTRLETSEANFTGNVGVEDDGYLQLCILSGPDGSSWCS